MSDRWAVRVGFLDLPPRTGGARRIARTIAEDMPGIVKMAHDSGDPEVVFHCFGGETRYVTRDGIKTLAETAGTTQWVLTGSTDDPHGGFWMEAPVKELGEQELWEVTLKRNRRTKVIRATSGHRWLVRCPDRVVVTQDLKKGQRLAHLRARQFDLVPDRDGIRMGFVYGDGSVNQQRSRTYGRVHLYGPKRDLAKYFDEVGTGREIRTPNGVPGLRYTGGMAGYTKNLPDLREEPEFLLGWLMGYFAADGTVSRIGQVSLSSASLEALEHVRDVATVLGIGTFEPHTRMRKGYGAEPTALHTMDFMAEDLKQEFFLRDDHRARVKLDGKPARIGWTVQSVRPTGKVEPVYCVRAHGTDTFVLEDNLHCGQCPFCGSGQVIARSDGTIECGFCQAAFTVQVQPRYPAFPQTIDGVPMQVPGMGPQWPGQDDDAMQAQQGVDADPDEDPNPFADDEDEETDQEPTDDSGGGNPFAKKSYRTAHGEVGLEPFLRYVALESARDRRSMLARLKERR